MQFHNMLIFINKILNTEHGFLKLGSYLDDSQWSFHPATCGDRFHRVTWFFKGGASRCQEKCSCCDPCVFKIWKILHFQIHMQLFYSDSHKTYLCCQGFSLSISAKCHIAMVVLLVINKRKTDLIFNIN